MGHHAAQALFVAAHAAVDGVGLPGADFLGPGGVRDELTAHGGALDAAVGQLGFHKIGGGQTAHAADGFGGQGADFVTEFEEAPLRPKSRVVFGRDGIAQVPVVGQRYMETGDARLFQQRHKHPQFRFQHTGVAVVGILLPDGQLIVDGQVGQAAPDGRYRLHGKAGAVFGAAAVGIGAVVEHRGAEAAAHPVAVDLHHIKAQRHRTLGRRAESLGDFFNFCFGQAGDVGPL